MGLSDEERISNIICIVNNLTDINPLKDDYILAPKINEILDNLWFDLLGAKNNSCHWLLGSSSDSKLIHKDDIFGLAMISSFSSDEPEKSITELYELNIDESKKKWYDYYDMYRPTALSLLDDQNDNDNKKVLWIFKLIENYIYSCNRYDDELSKSLNKLTKSLIKLKGFCFKIMSKDLNFFKAYAAEIVFDYILPYDTDDINEWFMNNYMHHSIKLDLIDKKDLFEAYKKAQIIYHNRSGERFSSNERLILILKFLGRRFHYKHQQKDLLKVIEKHNEDYPKDLIDLKKITALCNKSTVDHDKSQNTYENFWYCHLTNQSHYDIKKA